MPPRRHAIEDASFISGVVAFPTGGPSFQTVEAEHLVVIVKDLDEPVGVENETVAGMSSISSAESDGAVSERQPRMPFCESTAEFAV